MIGAAAPAPGTCQGGRRTYRKAPRQHQPKPAEEPSAGRYKEDDAKRLPGGPAAGRIRRPDRKRPGTRYERVQNWPFASK